MSFVSGEKRLFTFQSCDKNGSRTISRLPVDIENIAVYEPMGAVTGSHVLPVDHGYIHFVDPFEDNETLIENHQEFSVYAPAAGTIVYIGNIIQYHTDYAEMFEQPYHVDYDIAIEHACGFYTYLIHIDTLREDIVKQAKFREMGVPGHVHATVSIPVEEGEIIGSVSGEIFDFSLHDTSKLLQGFIYPKHYRDLEPKLYSVNIFDYIEEPVRSELLAKNIRKVEPLGGKIDYDIEGKLVGNWFKENTNYHRGIIKDRYWDGHLAITYDHIFPDQLRISTGDFEGRHKQFAVVGNAPDPATIDINSEVVEYELVNYWYFKPDETHWRGWELEELHPISFEDVQGVFLFQVLEGNRLKAEVFPGKTADEVNGFTENALIYER
jgi:hypothetical protein